ncbi:uncharacterized protein FA14DRAFT_179996 [Meira miltonrushii]|uniref:JmjC domain-containing protein n=1 Tax=Meira miltonrushii TaxID=1280837 RepID=A0A316V7C1_9BASI|nr:uncharacterized protein FA14DRAFT_179996 [Meira miltonrushii]PWN33342.1 hypothetical protein FA14DRAFT_179996 [Meira miltonrushii]
MSRQGKEGQNDGGLKDKQQKRPIIRQLRVPIRSNVTEEYRGFIPLPHSDIMEEEIRTLDAEIFWNDYVKRRCPTVINGLIDDNGFDGERWKDLNYLRSIAGSTQVKIEPVDPINDRFGTGAQRRIVTLSQFLDMLQDEKQAGKWYMTTQYIDDESEEEEISNSTSSDSSRQDEANNLFPRLSKDGTIASSTTTSPPTSTSQKQSDSDSPRILEDEELLPAPDLDFSLPPPTDALAHLFPLPTPKLLGGLVLQQCNLWLGNGTSGKSSGLHHDFHDNLYMVLSGCKRFLIWPPTCHRWLEPTGDIFRVHSNGLIEYDIADEPPLRADGLTSHEAALWRVRARKRVLLEADEAAASLAGEEKVKKALRKGKGKQTKEQEVALILLREAEMQELIIRMDNERNLEANGNVTSSDLSDDEIESDFMTDRSDSYGNGSKGLSDDESDTSQTFGAQRQSFGDKQFGGEGFDVFKALLSYTPMEEGEDDDSFEESEGSIDEIQDGQHRRKRRRAGSFLHIPPGGLPGGLRGSLRDPDGRYDSDISGDISDSDEFIMAAMEDDGQMGQEEIFNLPMVPVIEGEWSGEDDGEALGGNGAALRRVFPGNAFEVVNSEDDDEEDSDEDEDEEESSEEDSNEEKAVEVVTDNDDVHKLPFAQLDEVSSESSKAGEPVEEDEGSSEGALMGEGEDDSEEDEGALFAKLANAEDDEDEDEDEEEEDDDDEDVWPEDAEDGESLLNQLAAMEQNSAPQNGAKAFSPPTAAEKDEDPSSFSRIAPQALHWFFDVPNDPSNKDEIVSDDPPRIPGGPTLVPRENCPDPWEIHLKPGQMLYLPASWYHEVTSYCDPNEKDGNNVHMALNYWFHPPTAVESREGLSKRKLTALNLDGTPKVGKEARMQAKARSSGSTDIDENVPSARHPYLDREVWDEIRREVNRRVDEIRKRSAKKAERDEIISGKRKAESPSIETGEEDTTALPPTKRSRGDE